jgi:hypothetical protein
MARPLCGCSGLHVFLIGVIPLTEFEYQIENRELELEDVFDSFKFPN